VSLTPLSLSRWWSIWLKLCALNEAFARTSRHSRQEDLSWQEAGLFVVSALIVAGPELAPVLPTCDAASPFDGPPFDGPDGRADGRPDGLVQVQNPCPSLLVADMLRYDKGTEVTTITPPTPNKKGVQSVGSGQCWVATALPACPSASWAMLAVSPKEEC